MIDQKQIEPRVPDLPLASEAWVKAKLAELELRFERRLHEQTREFLDKAPHTSAPPVRKQSGLLFLTIFTAGLFVLGIATIAGIYRE